MSQSSGQGSTDLTLTNSNSAPPPFPSVTRALTPNPPETYTLHKRIWRQYVTPFDRIVDRHYTGSGTLEDPFIVDWIREDPEDPQAWSPVSKWFNIIQVSFATLAVALSSSAYSGGIDSLTEEFGSSTELLTAGISLFVLGFAFGPLFWAPLSEVYGRRLTYLISYFFLTLWTAVAAGSQTIAQLLVFRFLQGLFGSSPLANAGGTVSDVLSANQRGLGLALFAAAPFLGPALGPITGGFLGLKAGWRWIEGFLAIFCGVIFLVLLLFGAETYAPFILRTRAEKLSKITGRVYRFRADAKTPLNIGNLFKASLSRPWKFLIVEPIVTILSIYSAVIYGVLYLNFSAYPIIFQRGHGWNPGVGGLAFLGILVGVVIGVIICVTYINPAYIRLAKKRGGRATPEDRLPSCIWGGIAIVIGLAGFAATDGPDIHWIAPIIFGIPFGTGIILMFLSIIGYLIDSYTIYAASVLAANSVLRSLFGAAFPLFTGQMYAKLGIHWAAALPGFIALACIPFTIIFYKYGAKIRARCKYAADAERQMEAIMASRAAQTKTDEEDNMTSEGTTPVGGASANVKQTDDAGMHEKAPQSMPVEQAGGRGTVEQAGMDEKAAAAQHGHLHISSHPDDLHPSHPDSSHHHAWMTYEALADRDDVDLTDDERVQLSDLHENFYYAKAKAVRAWTRSPETTRETGVGQEHEAPFKSNATLVAREEGGGMPRVGSPPVPRDLGLGKPVA